MTCKIALAAILAVAASLGITIAKAEIGDYAFEPVAAEMKKGDDVIVAFRLVHKPTGKLVPDAVIVRTRVDMAPDGMADMISPVAVQPAGEPGVYAFKTDLPMAGRYQVSLAAKLQGEAQTLISKIVIKAVK